MPLLKVENISAGYDGERVIHALSFHVNRGEIISLLGPSGCGKTTALRAIAGFEPIIEGQITIDQKPVSTPTSTVPPEHRSIGMVFQDYALFPHLTVADNIAFGLRRKSAVDRRVRGPPRRFPQRREAWVAWVSAFRTNSRADNNSASHSRARWRRGRRCCSWTNRFRISMSSCASA